LPWHVLKHSCMADANQRSRSRKVCSLTHPKWALSACLRVVLSSVKRTCLIMFWENGNRNAHSWSESCWLGIYSIYFIYCYNIYICIICSHLLVWLSWKLASKIADIPKSFWILLLISPFWHWVFMAFAPQKNGTEKGVMFLVILKKVGKV
jgi:hypothetical protein